MKRSAIITLLALACAFALAFTACATGGGTAAPQATPTPTPEASAEPGGDAAGMPNPFTTVNSYSELIAACPGIAIYEVPEGSANVTYSYCADTDGKVLFAQEDFSYGEDTYQYRCAFCASEAETDDSLHGMYYDFNTDTSYVPDGALASCRLRTYDAEGIGVATWYLGTEQCEYSLTAQTSQDPATVIKAVLPELMPMEA